MSDYYEILGLDIRQGSKSFSQQDLKAAYRRALLRFHPDKDKTAVSKQKLSSIEGVTVDDVTQAYKTLSDSKLRTDYDQHIVKQGGQAPSAPHGRIHHTGLETVDLDSLVFDEQSQTWSRSCRCGDSKGFIVTEPELEKNAEHGELMVGCKGCSLWLRVLFGVAEEGEDG